MRVISFLATLPTKNIIGDTQKAQTLKYFINGVEAMGDQGSVSTQMTYQACDVAVILGWVHEQGKTAPHLSFRREILEKQKSRGGRTVIADSNLFLYSNTANPEYWLRYSYDGVFPNTGEYCDSNPDPSRWQAIQHSFNIRLKPYRENGNHVLICLQRDGGWSMGNINVVDWAIQVIQTIRQSSQRPIRIRPHPGDRQASRHCERIKIQCAALGIRDIEISSPTANLLNDLKHCWAVVNHNSSPTVGAAIEGFPIFVTDLDRSQCREIANTDLSRIEDPILHDRESWVQRISQFHWNHNELRNGQCWQHMRKWARA